MVTNIVDDFRGTLPPLCGPFGALKSERQDQMNKVENMAHEFEQYISPS